MSSEKFKNIKKFQVQNDKNKNIQKIIKNYPNWFLFENIIFGFFFDKILKSFYSSKFSLNITGLSIYKVLLFLSFFFN